MLSEQDTRCPHCYGNYIGDNEYFDVIVEAGVAEGMFSLDHLNQAGKIILIEGDPEWSEVLSHTFSEEIKKGKVVLINRFLSDKNDDCFVTLDKIAEEYIDSVQKLLIKMDIEGYEERALASSVNLIKKTPDVKIIACAYHHQKAEENIVNFLKKYDMSTESSKGFIFLFPEYEKTIFHEKDSEGIIPLLRRVLVVGKKEVSVDNHHQ